MNTFEPGRIYSGVVSGKRRYGIYSITGGFHFITDDGYQNFALCGEFTGVRGPLVVLDAHYYAECNWRDMATHLRSGGWGDIADQIEAQTKPPLQIGWHEVKDFRVPIYWDGEYWCSHPGAPLPTRNYTSTHYIGPGSDQS